MKKFFIPVIFLSLILTSNCAKAYVTQDEVYSEESMINYGYSYDFVDMIVSKNLPKKQFLTCKELVFWFKENQKWLIQVWKKLNYGK